MMDRRKEILEYIRANREADFKLLSPLVDDVVFLEERITELEKLPFIQLHPTDVMKQKATPAAKLYKELLQQYNNCMKIILLKNTGKEENETSPLRDFLKQRLKKE